MTQTVIPRVAVRSGIQFLAPPIAALLAVVASVQPVASASNESECESVFLQMESGDNWVAALSQQMLITQAEIPGWFSSEAVPWKTAFQSFFPEHKLFRGLMLSPSHLNHILNEGLEASGKFDYLCFSGNASMAALYSFRSIYAPMELQTGKFLAVILQTDPRHISSADSRSAFLAASAIEEAYILDPAKLRSKTPFPYTRLSEWRLALFGRN